MFKNKKRIIKKMEYLEERIKELERKLKIIPEERCVCFERGNSYKHEPCPVHVWRKL